MNKQDLECKVANAGGGREAALQVISNLVSTSLMSDLDPLVWPDDYESAYSKHRLPGSFATYEEYQANEAYDYDELPKDEWEESRERYLSDTRLTDAKTLLDALESLAADYSIPFDRDLIQMTATAFAENHPVWDMSVC